MSVLVIIVKRKRIPVGKLRNVAIVVVVQVVAEILVVVLVVAVVLIVAVVLVQAALAVVTQAVLVKMINVTKVQKIPHPHLRPRLLPRVLPYQVSPLSPLPLPSSHVSTTKGPGVPVK